MEQRHKKRLATCNSCTHFKEAARGNWFGYTPLCTDCPTQTGPNEYLDTGKTVTWVFNCLEALFCPNYEKADNLLNEYVRVKFFVEMVVLVMFGMQFILIKNFIKLNLDARCLKQI